MKRLYITIMVAVLLTACGHRASKGGSENTQDSLLSDTLEAFESPVFRTDSIGLLLEDTMAIVKISADWPISGQQALISNIRHYICEELAFSPNQEGEPEVKLYDDGKTAIETYIRKNYQELIAQKKEAFESGFGYGLQYSYYRRIFKFEDNDRYVTYLTNGEGFMGGAHGYATSTGITFRKSDGKRLGYHTDYNQEKGVFEMKNQTLFSQPESPQLAALLKEGIRSYFQAYDQTISTDDELKDMLIGIEDINHIPLPNTPPYFTKDGLCFTYQQYEIAAYAMGMITFNITYDKIRPFLTAEAAELVK